ncbi:endospore germination permease [Peribacillus sp. FSL K6-1552]|uniref:GerAB/ArcD/ProY family transporter n=1 Tax=Peribacillus sp. FSL K6-1552 TaxID=2954514 RepID=UPI0030FBAD3D
MLENGKISIRQFTILVILFTVGGSILIVPSGLASEAKQDGWIAGLLALGIGLLIIPFYYALGQRFQDKTIAEYSEELLGKWVGKLISLLFFTYFMINAGLTLRNIGDFMTTQFIPETPIEAIFIVFLAIVIIGTRNGIEPLSRSAEVLFPLVILLFIIFSTSLIPQIKFENIQPVFEVGIKPIIRGAIPFIGSTFLELVVFLMIFPYANKTNQLRKSFLTGTLIGGIILIFISLLAILTMGSEVTSRHLYPSYELARKINVADFLTRIEAILAGIWFVTIFIKLTVFFYASALSLAQTLKLKDYRFLTLPLGMILMVLALVSGPNIVAIEKFNKYILAPYSFTFGFVFPMLLLAINTFRMKGVKKNSCQ